MKNLLKIAALCISILPVDLFSSYKNNNQNRKNRSKNSTQHSNQIILIAPRDAHYFYSNFYYRPTMLSAQTHQQINPLLYNIEQLTTYKHDSLLNNDHIEAQELLKNRNLDQILSPNDIAKLRNCAIWAACDAIEQYNRAADASQPPSPTAGLRPPIEVLRKNAHKEFLAIPQFIRDSFRNDPNHPFANFFKEYREDRTKSPDNAFAEALAAITEYNQAIEVHGPQSQELKSLKNSTLAAIGKVPKSQRAENPDLDEIGQFLIKYREQKSRFYASQKHS